MTSFYQSLTVNVKLEALEHGACISTTEGGIHALKNPHSYRAYMVAQRL